MEHASKIDKDMEINHYEDYNTEEELDTGDILQVTPDASLS